MNKFLSLCLMLILAASCATQSEKNTKREKLAFSKTIQSQFTQTFGMPEHGRRGRNQERSLDL